MLFICFTFCNIFHLIKYYVWVKSHIQLIQIRLCELKACISLTLYLYNIPHDCHTVLQKNVNFYVWNISPNKMTTQITWTLRASQNWITHETPRRDSRDIQFSISLSVIIFLYMNNSRNSSKWFMRYSIFHIILYDNFDKE